MDISQLQVLKSNAGYYLGRTYHDHEINAWLPYDRQSDYFSTREQAEQALRAL